MSAVTQSLAALQAGWQWWRDGLAALMPQSWRDRLDTGVPVLAIDLVPEGGAVIRRFAAGAVGEVARLPEESLNVAALATALARELVRPWYLREAVALRLPDGAALKRTLSLPLAAQRDILGLLDIELERQSPVDRTEVYHAYRIVGVDRAAQRMEVDWRIVRRRSVDPMLALLREADIEPAVVAFVGDETPPDGGTFPVVARAARLLRLQRHLVRGLVLLIVALALLAVGGSYARNQGAIDAFAAHAEEVHADALVSQHLLHEIVAARQRAAQLVAERHRPTVADMLAETTRLLPDGSWLTGFSYRDGEVRIRGYSNAAPSLIALFDASPLFVGAEFRAPLTQGQSRDQQQFDLAFKVREATP